MKRIINVGKKKVEILQEPIHVFSGMLKRYSKKKKTFIK